MIKKCGLTSEPVLFIYSFIFIAYITTLPQLLLRKLCLEKYDNTTLCDNLPKEYEDEMQKEASTWTLIYFLCVTVPSFFAVIICGPLSDLVGRRRIMLTFPLLSTVQNAVFYISSEYIHTPVWYFMIAGVSAGLFGDLQGVLGSSYAVIASVTAENVEARTRRMALLEVFFFVSSSSGGLVSGFILHRFGFQYVFGLNIALNIFLCIYILFFIPSEREAKRNEDQIPLFDKDAETENEEDLQVDPAATKVMTKEGENIIEKEIPSEEELLEEVDHRNPLLHIKEMLVECEPSERWFLLSLVSIYFAALSGILVDIDLTVLYLTNAPFNCSPDVIGYYIFFQGMLRAFGVFIITQVVERHFPISDYYLVLVGFVSQCAVYTSIGLSRSLNTLFAVNILGMFVPLPVTVIRSISTKIVAAKHHGAIVGMVMAVDVLSQILINFIILGLYKATLEYYSGIAFFAVVGVELCGMLIFAITARNIA